MDGMQGSLGEGQLGSGLAQNAAILNQFRQPYMQMAQQMMEQGQEPPPFEQWASQQAQAQQPAPQDRRGLLSQLFSRLQPQVPPQPQMAQQQVQPMPPQ